MRVLAGFHQSRGGSTSAFQHVLADGPVDIVDVHAFGKFPFDGLGFRVQPDAQFGIQVEDARTFLGKHLDGFVGDRSREVF